MKRFFKRTIAFCVVLLLAFSTVYTFASDVIELPMIPIGQSNYATLSLDSNADPSVYEGQKITFTTTISDIDKNGIGKVEIEYAYSGEFTYLEDFYVSGLPHGWRSRADKVSFGKLLVTLEKGSSQEALYSNALITFSFEGDRSSHVEMSLGFGKVSVYKSSGEVVARVSKKISNCSFSAETATPAFNNIGASLRINNTPALRFGMMVTKDSVFNKYFETGTFTYSDNAEVKFGMVLIPTANLSGELFYDTQGARVEMFKEAFTENSNDAVFVMTENAVTDYSKSYTFRPFMMHKNPDGSYSYIYGEALERSAKSVAQAELLTATDEVAKYLLEKFVK